MQLKRGWRALTVAIALILVMPSALTQAATPVASPAASPAAQPADPLAGRLGGDQKSFEAVWGEGKVNPKYSTSLSSEVDYTGLTDKRFGEIDVRYYKKKSAWVIFIFSNRPTSKPFTNPDPADWSIDEATAIATEFLPRDAKVAAASLHEDPNTGYPLMRCSSASLKTAFSAAVYKAYGSTARRGDCEIFFSQNTSGDVPYLVVRLASYARPPEVAAPLTGDEKAYLDQLEDDAALVARSYTMFTNEVTSSQPLVINLLSVISLWLGYAANVDSRLAPAPERLASLDKSYRAALQQFADAGQALSDALMANDNQAIDDAFDAISLAHRRLQTVRDQAALLRCCST
jgi:hypothetical protein